MKSNKKEIAKQIKALEAMKKCTTKEFNMAHYITEGTACDTALCIAGDGVARKYGVRRATQILTKSGVDFELVAGKIFGLKRDPYTRLFGLFHVDKWSDFNRDAYREAKLRGDSIGMINAGISELCRYL